MRSTRGSFWATGLAIAVALALVAGCSGGTPDGFRTLDQGRLEVDVPEEWQQGEFTTGEFWDVVLQDEADTEDPQLRFVAASDFPDTDANLAMTLLQTSAAFGEPDESGGFTQVLVEDDHEMWRWDFTYGNGSHQGVAWTLDDKASEHVVGVAVLTRGELDDATVGAIEDSIRILPTATE